MPKISRTRGKVVTKRMRVANTYPRMSKAKLQQRGPRISYLRFQEPANKIVIEEVEGCKHTQNFNNKEDW